MSERFVRSIHEGKTCPECGGCHYGSNHCAFSAEGRAEDAEAMKRRVEKPPAPRTFTAEEVEPLVAFIRNVVALGETTLVLESGRGLTIAAARETLAIWGAKLSAPTKEKL